MPYRQDDPLYRKVSRGMLLLALLLLLGACATGGFPGEGPSSGGYPSDGRNPSPASSQALQGTVSNVDHNNRRFLIDHNAGGRADIAYDERTRLMYQGQQRPVRGLEPGDRVRVYAQRDRSLWRAEEIEVLQDGRGGEGSSDDAAERHGVITQVDTRIRQIEFNEGGFSGPSMRAGYDARTIVEYRGQRYPVDALERGDQVRMRLERSDRGWIAERIVVEVSSRER